MKSLWNPHLHDELVNRIARLAGAYGVLAYKHIDHHLRQFGV